MHIPFSRTLLNYFKERRWQEYMKNSGWVFSPKQWQDLRYEWSDWKKHYLPIDLRGKIVLDIGAKEGDTAKFFLEHGAKKVICVECNPERLAYLKGNAYGRPIEVIEGKFDVSILWQLSYDFCKMDIEGWEYAMNFVSPHILSKPLVVEVHGMQLIELFRSLGYRMAKGVDEWINYAYWKC